MGVIKRFIPPRCALLGKIRNYARYSASVIHFSYQRHCQMSTVALKRVKPLPEAAEYPRAAPVSQSRPSPTPRVARQPVTGCSARQFEIFVSDVVCETGSGVTGVTPSDKNCPAAGVAMDAKRAKINGMTRRKRYWGNKKDISSIILRVSPSSADGVKARMAVGPRATGNVSPLMRA